MKKLQFFGLIVGFILAGSCQNKNGTQTIFSTDGTWVDLSHSYNQETPYWPTAEGFHLDTVFEGFTDGGYYYSAFQFSSAEHGGTHIDAPIHFAQGKQTVDEIPLDRLIGPAVIIDVTDSVNDYVDYQIGIADIQNWESKYGPIPEEAIVLLRTGFEHFWPNKLKYLGTAAKGPAAVASLHFPGLHPEAAQWLVDNRSIGAIGLDTPSIDYGRSSDFKSHQILFKQNIPAFENLAHLNELPEWGAYVVALPMKISGGSGGPLRIVAFVPGAS